MGLERFIDAQEGVFDGVRAELGAGRKTGHWMWFVFPQAVGLGTSSTARFYAIASLEEASAYAAHPVLGARLREGAGLLLSSSGQSAEDVLGAVDAMKLSSSMTLFQAVATDEAVFSDVLARFFDGAADPATLRILAGWRSQASGPGAGSAPDNVGP